MTLPSSGVNVELGNPSNQNLNLDRTEVRDLFEVPSGQISLSDGYGKTAVTVNLTDHSIAHSQTTGNTATAGVRVKNSPAALQRRNGNSYTAYTDEWSIGHSGHGDDYQVRATHISGTVPAGDALGSWLAMTSDREWLIQSTSGIVTSSFTLEIRKGTGAVLDSCTIDLHAEIITM